MHSSKRQQKCDSKYHASIDCICVQEEPIGKYGQQLTVEGRCRGHNFKKILWILVIDEAKNKQLHKLRFPPELHGIPIA